MGNTPTTQLPQVTPGAASPTTPDPTQHPAHPIVKGLLQMIGNGMQSYAAATEDPKMQLERQEASARLSLAKEEQENLNAYREAQVGERGRHDVATEGQAAQNSALNAAKDQFTYKNGQFIPKAQGDLSIGQQLDNAEKAANVAGKGYTPNAGGSTPSPMSATNPSMSSKPSNPLADILSPTPVGKQTPQQQATLASTQAGTAGKQATTAKTVADTGMAQKQLDEKYREFQSSDQYRRWKENLDVQTKLDIAKLTAGKAPAGLIQTATYAKGGLDTLKDTQDAMSALEAKGVMGSLPANWIENWLFGKGAVDPRLDPETRQLIGKLQTSTQLTAGALQRAHTGRGMMEMYRDLKNQLGPGQDWNALKGAQEETRSLLTQYALSASDAAIRNIRGGTNLDNPLQPGNGGPDPFAQFGGKAHNASQFK